MRLKIFGMFILIGLFLGCSSTPKAVKVVREKAEVAHELQKPVVVETSKDDKRPDWTKTSVYEDDEKVCFTGGYLNGVDYSLTIRCANAEALKVACQSISQFIQAEFSGYIQGSNNPGEGIERYVSDGIATFTRSLHVQGTKQAEIYYEEVFSPMVMKPAYNIWVRLEMTRVDYMSAKAEALQGLLDKFSRDGNERAKEKAERLLEELKRETI